MLIFCIPPAVATRTRYALNACDTQRVMCVCVCMQLLDVSQVTYDTPLYEQLRDACAQRITDSFSRAQAYVLATFEVRIVLLGERQLPNSTAA